MSADFDLILKRLSVERENLGEGLKRVRTGIRCNEEKGNTEDGAIEGYESEKQLILEKQIVDSLGEVERALRKFELGTYGLCDKCGKRIDPARLKAIPQARLCLSCKIAQEKGGRVRLSPVRNRLGYVPEAPQITPITTYDGLEIEEDEYLSDELNNEPDMLQTDDKDVVVESPLSGLPPEEVDISMSVDTVTVRGEPDREKMDSKQN